MIPTIKLIIKKSLLLSIFITSFQFAQNWHLQNSGTQSNLTGIQMISPTSGWACGDAGVLVHTNNAGETWSSVVLTGADLHKVVFKDALTGIVVGDDGTVFATTNAGQNWEAKNSATSAQLRSVTYAGGSTFYAAGRDGAVIKSTDDGNSWTTLSSGTTERLLCISAVGDLVWIGGRDGILIHSTNGGTSFQLMTSPAPDDIKDIQFLNSSAGFAAGSNSFFMLTSDGGNNWISRSSGILNGLNGLHFITDQNGWVVGGNGTLYTTTNAGLTWVLPISNTNQDLNSIHSLDGENVWAVGNMGEIITNYSSATGIEQVKYSSPTSFVLEQNFPNPFNPSTQITFGLPHESSILLEVYNIIGQKVAELVNEKLSPGYYTVNFDATGFSNGIYLYVVTGNNFSITKKMIVLK